MELLLACSIKSMLLSCWSLIFTVYLIKCTSLLVLFIIFITLNWFSKLWVDLNANFSLLKAREKTSNYKKEENSFRSWAVHKKRILISFGWISHGEYQYALTFLFILSYFWFLRSFYYDSRLILGQRYVHDLMFSSQLQYWETHKFVEFVEFVLFFPTWRRSFFRILRSAMNILNCRNIYIFLIKYLLFILLTNN